MKDLVSRLTFDIVMAEFVPGAIVVFAIGFLCAAVLMDDANSMRDVACKTVAACGSSIEGKVISVLLCTGAGCLSMASIGPSWRLLKHSASR